MHYRSVLQTIKLYRNFWDYYRIYLRQDSRRQTLLKTRCGLDFWVRPKLFDHIVVTQTLLGLDYGSLWERIKPESVVVDVGAQIGTVTLMMARRARTVVAYEPIPDNFRLLKKNCRLNRMKQVMCRPVGVAEKKGVRRFAVAENGQGSLTSKSRSRTASLPCVNLERDLTALGITGVDVLKLDCEGAEFLILPSLSARFLRGVHTIVLEYHDNETRHHATLMAMLRSRGFRVNITPSARPGLGILLARK